MVESVEYNRPSTDLDGSIEFTHMKFRNNDNMKTMFFIFGQYNIKWLIELDASLARPIKDIQKHFIQPKISSSCMQVPDEEVSLADLWSCICFISCIAMYFSECCIIVLFYVVSLRCWVWV